MLNRFRGRRPSPALVVAIVAVVLSMAGTAVAARALITSSSQIRAGVVNSGDVKDGSLTGRDLKASSVTADKVKNGTLTLDDLATDAKGALQSEGTQAQEAYRKEGPAAVAPGATARVATLRNLAPGVYAIFAKTVITADEPQSGLLKQGQSVSGHCALDAGGDRDEARTMLGGPGAMSPGTVHLQITRSFASAGTVALDCDVEPSKWRATDTSIVAIRLARAPRSPVDG
jgi:hypothetical protein